MTLVPVLMFAQAESGDSDVEIEEDFSIDDYEEEEPEEVETETYELFDVSERAEFKGGDNGLNQFLAENITYPKPAIQDSVDGTVMLMFVIDKKGAIKDVEVISKKIGYGLEEEAIRVLKATSGMWKPAMQRDKPVNMRFRLPVRFVLF